MDQPLANTPPQFHFRLSHFNLHCTVDNTQGKYVEAELLYEKCQEIQKKVLGTEHPSFATTLNDRALLLERQVRAVRYSVGNPGRHSLDICGSCVV